MTVPATAATLALLDRLKVSDDIWLQSADEGRAVAEHILGSQSPIVLLYGPARGGSTEFMQRWVVPVLSERARVVYRATGDTGSYSEATEEHSIQIWDGFERYLANGSGGVLAYLASLTADGHARKSVLIVQEDYLSRLFQARDVVPGILDDVFAIPAMPPAKFTEALARTTAGLDVALSAGFVASLARDLDAVRTRAALGPELVAIVAFELYRFAGASHELSKEDYVSRDGLGGILAGHIDFLFESLPGGVNPEIGWAVLQEVVRTGIGIPTDLADVASRFDVDVDVPARVAAWLEADRRVLQANTEGGHDVVPALLAKGVEHHVRQLNEVTEHTRSMLRLGSRQFNELHALPPEQTFRRINAQRSALLVTDEEARLMLRCALAYADGQNGDALQHWLRRVKSPTATVEILLDALFDSSADVRERAARCLGAFNTQDVRDQLHLSALRDPAAAVRSAAIDALKEISTPALRSALTRETLDPNSPYRLQAIDALRIFKDDETVNTLVTIVGGTGPGHEEPARLRAVEVLGLHGTPQSVSALAKIAVHDRDVADWEAAAAALGRVSSEESAGAALEAVRAERRAVPDPLASRPSLRALAVGSLYVALALGILIGNFIAHGLILFVIGRRKAALLFTAGEVVAAIAAVQTWPSAFGVLSLMALLAGSLLVPMRILFLEQRDGVPQHGLRRALSLVLFAFGCVSVFLLVHGVASALIRRVKRGLIITAFQAAGICLISSSLFLAEDVSIDSHRDVAIFAWAAVATGLLKVLAYALLAGTYAVGVGTAFLDLFAWPGRRELSCRLDSVYKQLLCNPHGSRVLLQRLTGTEARGIKWGKALARRYRSLVHEDLTKLWTDAVPAVKARIFWVMSRRPDARSVEFLRRVSRTLGMKERLRAAVAVWTYRFSIWPKSLLLFTTLAVLVLVLYTTALWDLTEHNPWGLMRAAEQADDDALDAIQRLKTMAGSSEPQVTAAATTSLHLALATVTAPGRQPQAGDLKAMNAMIDAFPPRSSPRLEATLGAILRNPSRLPETRARAIRALQRTSSWQAVDVLRRFAASAPEAPPSLRGGSEDSAVTLKRQALHALRDMTGAGVAPLVALLGLQDSLLLSDDLKAEAKRAADGADPLVWAEYQLERSDYGAAYDRLSAAEQSTRQDGAYQQRVRNALAKVHLRRGLVRLRDAERDPTSSMYVSAASDLSAALSSGADADSLQEAASYGLRLGFLLHESIALNDRSAFEESYRVFSSVAPRNLRAANDQEIRVAADLAEATLTVGRYDEAYAQAMRVLDELGNRSNPIFQNTSMNLKFVAFAALLLKKDEEGAKRMSAELFAEYDSKPAGFQNDWEYSGTLHYLDSPGIPSPSRRTLRAAIERIMAPKSGLP